MGDGIRYREPYGRFDLSTALVRSDGRAVFLAACELRPGLAACREHREPRAGPGTFTVSEE